jgi:glycosyltransferase involved in cell wall biosynthesis
VVARGLGDVVLCPGFERDVLACVRGADLLVNPSLSEGMPNAVLEAMAMGVPVVATDVGGVPELIMHGETGLLVPAGDPAALARAVVSALGDRDASARRAASARRFVDERCSFAAQSRSLVRVYRRLLSAKPTGSGVPFIE